MSSIRIHNAEATNGHADSYVYGVWVVFGWDDPYYVVSIHDDELKAYRCTSDGLHVAFVPFGEDFPQALRSQAEILKERIL